jgi:hypothetical protein
MMRTECFPGFNFCGSNIEPRACLNTPISFDVRGHNISDMQGPG